MNRFLKIMVLAMLQAAAFSAHAQNITLQPYMQGEGITFSSANKYSIRISGFGQPGLETRSYTGASDDQKTYTRFRMRRLVTYVTGSAPKQNINYQVQLDLTGNSDGGGDAGTNNYLMDAWVSWSPSKRVEITFGQESSPTDNREMNMRSNTLQLIDRSPLSLAFASIREFGVFVSTNYKIAQVEREKVVLQFRQTVLNAVGEVSNSLASIEQLKEQSRKEKEAFERERREFMEKNAALTKENESLKRENQAL
ncbi:MAG: porin, partial [Bacteroidota bacterium]